MFLKSLLSVKFPNLIKPKIQKQSKEKKPTKTNTFGKEFWDKYALETLIKPHIQENLCHPFVIPMSSPFYSNQNIRSLRPFVVLSIYFSNSGRYL